MTDILHICSTKVTPTLKKKSCMIDSCAPVFSENSWCKILSFLCWVVNCYDYFIANKTAM